MFGMLKYYIALKTTQYKNRTFKWLVSSLFRLRLITYVSGDETGLFAAGLAADPSLLVSEKDHTLPGLQIQQATPYYLTHTRKNKLNFLQNQNNSGAFCYLIPAHLAATWLAWQGRSPSRCGQQYGRWWRVWWCSRCGRWTGWRSGLDRRGLAHSTPAWRPAEPGQMLSPRSSGSSGWPGRQSTL